MTGRHARRSGRPIDGRPRVGRARHLAATLVLVATTVTTLALQPAVAAGKGPVVSPCGRTIGRPHYDHVVWIVLENVGYAVVGSNQAPYLNGLASACGLATNDWAVGHPSLPNYIALTSGSTQGVTDDGEPSVHRLTNASVFSQLGGRWRALVESMRAPCDRVTNGLYAARHNPAVYYAALGAQCRRNDVPLVRPFSLGASFTFIVPNICDDMHSCSISVGDAWLARTVPAILSSREFQLHSLVLFITFDENDSDPKNRVPTYVIAPSVPRGTRVGQPFTHYSLLRTTEALLGLPPLGEARHAASMIGPFDL